MVDDRYRDHHSRFRSNGGRGEVWSFSLGRDEFVLKSDVLCNGFVNRIYAMTERSKLFGAALLTLIAAQFCFGIYSIGWVAIHPSKFLDYSSIHMRTQFGL